MNQRDGYGRMRVELGKKEERLVYIDKVLVVSELTDHGKTSGG